MGVYLQGSLFAQAGDAVLGPLCGVLRAELGDGAWIDLLTCGCGEPTTCVRLAADVPWKAEQRRMCDRTVDVPWARRYGPSGSPAPNSSPVLAHREPGGWPGPVPRPTSVRQPSRATPGDRGGARVTCPSHLMLGLRSRAVQPSADRPPRAAEHRADQAPQPHRDNDPPPVRRHVRDPPPAEPVHLPRRRPAHGGRQPKASAQGDNASPSAGPTVWKTWSQPAGEPE